MNINSILIKWIKRWNQGKKRKIQRELFGKKKEMEEQKSYGFTKIMWIETKKKKYRSSSDDSIMLLLQFRVLSSFDCIDLSDGIIKS